MATVRQRKPSPALPSPPLGKIHAFRRQAADGKCLQDNWYPPSCLTCGETEASGGWLESQQHPESEPPSSVSHTILENPTNYPMLLRDKQKS